MASTDHQRLAGATRRRPRQTCTASTVPGIGLATGRPPPAPAPVRSMVSRSWVRAHVSPPRARAKGAPPATAQSYRVGGAAVVHAPGRLPASSAGPARAGPPVTCRRTVHRHSPPAGNGPLSPGRRTGEPPAVPQQPGVGRPGLRRSSSRRRPATRPPPPPARGRAGAGRRRRGRPVPCPARRRHVRVVEEPAQEAGIGRDAEDGGVPGRRAAGPRPRSGRRPRR